MSNYYYLVNPYIQGDFKNKVKADNSIIAAKVLYKNLAEHFNNAVPKFYFTIQKSNSSKTNNATGKMYHFKSIEERNNDEINFTISPYTIKDDNINTFTNNLNNFKNKIQKGGKKDKKNKKSKKSKKSKNSDSESDSDSSDSDEYVKKISTYTPILNQPIYYWWYDPYIYGLNSIYIPTFYPYITPVIEYSLIYP